MILPLPLLLRRCTITGYISIRDDHILFLDLVGWCIPDRIGIGVNRLNELMLGLLTLLARVLKILGIHFRICHIVCVVV